MTDERIQQSALGSGVADTPMMRQPPADDYELITDELMGVASPADVAESRERALRDPRYRARKERLTAAWATKLPDEPLDISDDRVALADLWRRIGEQERHEAAPAAPGKGWSMGRENAGQPDERAVLIDAEPWYRVLPPAWIARVVLSALAGAAAVGWVIYEIVMHRVQ